MANPVMHFQILTKQPKKLEEFYAALFGWKTSGDNALGYRDVDTTCKEGINGGFWPMAEKEGHSMVQLFIRVADVKAHAQRAESLGARIIVPPQILPDGDEMAIAVDPDGIPFAMFRGKNSAPH
jgi:predicted enzyme related to lactoylglutathione lyase